MSELIDNRAQRIRTLKEVILHLHQGNPPDAVRARMQALVGQTDHSEIIAMEQELIADGMPVEQIQSMCDLHSQVTRDVVVQLRPREIAPGHPVDTFRRENAALREAVSRLRAALAASTDLLPIRQAANDLADIDKHYQRKEHALFSKLEAHGINGPSKVMWAKDDEVRSLLKAFTVALRSGEAIAATGERVAAAIEEMIYKEENILLPMSLETLTEDEWGEIWLASPRYGWCLVEPREGYRPPESVEIAPQGGASLPTGNLSLEQLRLIFSTLPVDLTFVDADDRVAFFSEGPDRVFARSKAIIGRKVQNCHPPRSVETVDRILADFRAGRQSVAEFWINFHNRFVHIRYFAVRNEDGAYQGTLEVTQDATALRQLEGERRLLQYAS